MKNILIIILVSVGIGQNIESTDAVENVLDNLHLYASEANGKKYFDLFANNTTWCIESPQKFKRLYLPNKRGYIEAKIVTE